jgi:hypothetical protein
VSRCSSSFGWPLTKMRCPVGKFFRATSTKVRRTVTIAALRSMSLGGARRVRPSACRSL